MTCLRRLLTLPYVASQPSPLPRPLRLYTTGVVNLAREAVDLDPENDVSNKELLRAMLSYVWPKDRRDVKLKVVGALSLLGMAKVRTPFLIDIDC